MMSRLLLIPFCLSLTGIAFGGEDPAGAPTAKDMLRARLAEESKIPPGKAGTPTAAPPITDTAKAVADGTDKNPLLAPTAQPMPADTGTATKAEAKKQPATVLPKVEVKKSRITVLDQQLAKQDELIAREKKNTKPSELDKALNDERIARPLSILGGESTQVRKQISSQRVSLMEDEKDLIEAIAQAKTKAEKEELQKQLDALRAERRELERAMR